MRYQYIGTKIWHDEKFISLSPLEQRLFLYLLTSPHGNLIGLYVLKCGYACDDLNCTKTEFLKGMEKLCEAKLIKYDFKLSLIWILNFLKHNPLTNPNQVKASKNILQELPKSSVLLDFLNAHTTLSEGLIEGLKEGLYEGLPKDSGTGTGTGTDSGVGAGIEVLTRIVPYSEIINDLNQQTEKHFLNTAKSTRDMIKILWSEGFKLEDFKKVHNNMAIKWKDDPKMNQYLRPATLYQPKKFEGYLNSKITLSDQGKVSPMLDKSKKVFQEFIEEQGAENAKRESL